METTFMDVQCLPQTMRKNKRIHIIYKVKGNRVCVYVCMIMYLCMYTDMPSHGY